MSGKTRFRLHRPARNDYPYGRLSPEVRLIIGMRQSTDATDRQIADELDCNLRELRSFEKRILKDEIGGWVSRNGMPASFGEPLDQKVKCRLCKNWIIHAPCVQCCTFQGSSCRNDSEPELPFDPLATDAMPGSQEKIEVMVDRAKLGYSIFSPSDRRDFSPVTETASD